LDAPWLSLRGALRLAVRIVKKDERWIALIRKTEQRYLADPGRIEILRLMQRDPFKQAIVNVAREALKHMLWGGRVKAIGFHCDKQLRAPIDGEAWSTRHIDVAASVLVPHDGRSKDFPPITGVVVNSRDVQAVFGKTAAATSEATEEPAVTARKPFPDNRFSELREFLSKRQPRNEGEAWDAAEAHFNARITRERIREARKAINSKGKPGRRRKNSATRRHFTRSQIVSTT
jgi:hypothetical protein